MKKIKLLVTGCMGRMGQQIIKSVKKDKNFKLVALTENRRINSKISGIKVDLNAEELFKKDVLAIELPNRKDLENLDRSLDKDLLRRMYNNEPMSANMNYKYFMDQQMMSTSTKYQLPSNPLLNPVAWVKFIKAIKNGDFKRKD